MIYVYKRAEKYITFKRGFCIKKNINAEDLIKINFV